MVMVQLVVKCVDGVSTASVSVTVCLDSSSNFPSKASINNGVLAVLIVPALVSTYHLIFCDI